VRLLSACLDGIRTIAADFIGRDGAELDRRTRVSST
jgi:hypothetical protein